MRYGIALIGLGRIGWRGFDDPAIETHYSAVSNHPRLRVMYAVDSEASVRAAFQEATGTLVYETAGLSFAEQRPEIVTVATPPETHHEICIAAIRAGAQAILCEKPLATSVSECRDIVDQCARHDVILAVGHQRRYESTHLMLRAFINSGTLGKPVAANAWFPGEYLNNGVHAADVCRMMVGDDLPKGISQVDKRFGVSVACERGDVSLDSYGHYAPGYMRTMYDNLIESLEGRERVLCSGEDGLEAVRIALEAERSVQAA